MGIKGFSKIFRHRRIVKWNNAEIKSLAIDAMTELHRAALGGEHINTLTDSAGRPTLHISVYLSNILELKKNNIDQIHVFDYVNDTEEFHNPIKSEELEKRRKAREKAENKLKEINASIDNLNNANLINGNVNNVNNVDNIDNVGNVDNADKNVDNVGNKNIDRNIDNIDNKSDSESINSDDDISTFNNAILSTNDFAEIEEVELQKTDRQISIEELKSKLEKRVFHVNQDMRNDIIEIMNYLGIKYIFAPKGIEGECVASWLNKKGIVDGVYSGDTDPIAFGAQVLFRRNTRDKKIYEYHLSDILNQIKEENENVRNPTLSDVRKISVIVGTDFAKKTPNIGDKTVIKKYPNVELTKEQINAIAHFEKEPSDVKIYNENVASFSKHGIADLLDWLEVEKSFNRIRMEKLISAALNGSNSKNQIIPPDTSSKVSTGMRKSRGKTGDKSSDKSSSKTSSKPTNKNKATNKSNIKSPSDEKKEKTTDNGKKDKSANDEKKDKSTMSNHKPKSSPKPSSQKNNKKILIAPVKRKAISK